MRKIIFDDTPGYLIHQTLGTSNYALPQIMSILQIELDDFLPWF
jgi:hypothetical protein